jgi:hypothetical protein
VAEDLGFYGWLSADHPSRVPQKCCLWQGATPFDGQLFRGLEGGEGVLRVSVPESLFLSSCLEWAALRFLLSPFELAPHVRP